MSSDIDDGGSEDSLTTVDNKTSFQILTDILQNASGAFNSTILQKYDEIITRTIKTSNISGAEEASEQFHDYFLRQTKKLDDEHTEQMITKFKEIITRSITIAGLSTTNINIPAQDLLELTRFVNTVRKEFVDEVLKLVPSYYADQLLELDVVDVRLSQTASALIKKLTCCVPGPTNWREYEDVCTEILEYCFTPPLLPPAIQEPTEEHDQRRDIILHIPMGIEGFWRFISDKYGIAVIVECKNYTDRVNQNTFVISSKYFSGDPRLTPFGMILTRLGLDDSAKVQQKREWQRKTYIICLNDEDLIQMIKLKELAKEPEIIINKKFREFLTSL